MSLPNPGMSASPFQIYTAEEVNDEYENIESLADGSGFNNTVIDVSKIKTSSYPVTKLTFTNKDSTATATQLVSYTVPSTGLYLCIATVSFNRNGGSSTVATVDILYNGTVRSTGSTQTPSDNSRQLASLSYAGIINTGQVIALNTVTGAGLVATNNTFSSITIVRIA